jgi:hypothetical protein
LPDGKQKLHGEHTLLLQKTQEKGRQILLNFPRSFISLGNSKNQSLDFSASIPVCAKTGQNRTDEKSIQLELEVERGRKRRCLRQKRCKILYIIYHIFQGFNLRQKTFTSGAHGTSRAT